LADRPDAAEVAQRHAGYFRALAEQADRPLRDTGQGEWLDQLDAEAANLAVAVRWYLAHEPGPLPHLFRVLWLFWLQRDLEGQARSWVEQFRPRRPAGPAGPGRPGLGGGSAGRRHRGRPGGAGGRPAPGPAAGREPGPLSAGG